MPMKTDNIFFFYFKQLALATQLETNRCLVTANASILQLIRMEAWAVMLEAKDKTVDSVDSFLIRLATD